ncbi:hypothetical protein CLBKND_00443 [Methylorubrum aminovorans]
MAVAAWLLVSRWVEPPLRAGLGRPAAQPWPDAGRAHPLMFRTGAGSLAAAQRSA